jgi:dihydrodipicolinate synthase/N-acetylneuraminate lyase
MNTLLPSLEIDLAASQLFQAALIRDGVHGLVLMGTVGEGNSLSAQEKHSVLAGLLAGHHAI